MLQLKTMVRGILTTLLGEPQTARLISSVRNLTGIARPVPPPAPAPSPPDEPPLPPKVAALAANYRAKRINSFLLNERMIKLQDGRIADVIGAFFAKTDCLRTIRKEEIMATLSDFRRTFLDSPITMNVYGANFPSGANLFCLTRHIAPTLIVESGVYKGQSSYLMSAACPNASVLAFDVNLNDVAYRAPRVIFYENDWMQTDVKCSPTDRGFGFFDDHQNQAMRIIQAHERGFRFLLLDDSWPIDVITGDSWPPVPTVDMIVSDAIRPGETIDWIAEGRPWTYTHDQEMVDLCARALRLIKTAYEVPSLYRECGIAPTSAYKFVELN